MPAPYSQDLREKMVACYEQGELSQEAVAKRFLVSVSCFKRLWKRYQETGRARPGQMGGWVKPKVDEAGGRQIEAWLEEAPDLTLAKLCERYESAFGVSMSPSAMDRGLKRLKITRKKKTPYDPEQKSPRVQQLRAEHREIRAQIPDEASVYIDKSGAGCDLTPTFGRAPRGQRAYDEKPTSQGERISTLGALSCRGLETALCFEGTLNGSVFLFFLEHFLCPILKPGQWVIMDNASAHKVEGVAELIEETGARLLYLPPYSPEYNPIELAWAVAKQQLRKLKARTKEDLYEAWAIALKAISPTHAQQFFRHTRKVAT